MSMGMIKSGEYVPCGASATLMSQYPMKPMTDIIEITATQLYNGWTAPCAGELISVVMSAGAPYAEYFSINGVTICVTSMGDGVSAARNFILNKGDVISITPNGTALKGSFRPFAVGEVL